MLGMYVSPIRLQKLKNASYLFPTYISRDCIIPTGEFKLHMVVGSQNNRTTVLVKNTSIKHNTLVVPRRYR